MEALPGEKPRSKHDSFASLRQRNFQLYSLNRVLATIGQTMLQAVLAWHVYDLTGSALNLGFLGLARFIPSLATSLVGGAVADAYDRRVVMVVAKVVPLSCAAVLAAATVGGWISIELIFGLVILMGFAASFEGPARIALLPAVVRPETFENAVAVSNTMQQLAMVSGPALGGTVIALAGPGAGYGLFCALILTSLVPLALLRLGQISGTRRALSLASIKEGVEFVRTRQVLLGAMSLDMFAVIFGGAQALLPVYASDILHAGPTGYGVLSSAMQAGAFAMSLVLIARPPVQQTGRVLVYSVIVYGLFTAAFGLSQLYLLSVILYACIGAADQVSVVMRQTTIQMATPDELRGRVSSVNQVFVGASGQIGGMRAGFVASVAGASFAVVSGGLGAMAVAALIAWRMPQLFKYEILRQDGQAEVPSSSSPPSERAQNPVQAS
jgi:MFS family permease